MCISPLFSSESFEINSPDFEESRITYNLNIFLKFTLSQNSFNLCRKNIMVLHVSLQHKKLMKQETKFRNMKRLKKGISN